MEFIAKPAQVEMKINEWKGLNCGYMQFDSIDTYSGQKVHAVIFSTGSGCASKPVLYFSQPHAHEPATTAGMMDVMEQLATGKDLTGMATKFDVEKILSELIIIFSPIGNPYGVDRSPCLYWDGSKYSNEKFWTIIFGDDPDNPGKQWHRLGQWDIREYVAPDPIGIVYEPIDEFTYVEPNRSQLSSYFKMFHRLNGKYSINYWAELHQTEFVDSEHDTMIILSSSDSAPEHISTVNSLWAQKVTEAWKNSRFNPKEPSGSGYKGQQAAYFKQNYNTINQKTHRLTSEVKNNAKDFPAEKQLKANVSVIETSIGFCMPELKAGL